MVIYIQPEVICREKKTTLRKPACVNELLVRSHSLRFGELVAIMLRNDCPEHMHEDQNVSYSDCRVCSKKIRGDRVRVAAKRKNEKNQNDSFHQIWVIKRQSEERKISIIQRIEGIAKDASIENFLFAAELLYKTADHLRFLLLHDKNICLRAEDAVHLRANLCDGCAKVASGCEAISGLSE